MARPRRQSLRQIFALPFVLFAISLAGLVAALLIDGWADAVLSVAAGAGLVALVWLFLARR